MRLFACVWVLLVLVGPLVRPTRGEIPPFKVFTSEEGLAHDSVSKIVRDSRGFLWFCTAEGLSRFDGSRFTNFTTDHGLPHRDINDFFETSQGIYLVATAAGVAVFDPTGTPYRWNVLEQRLEQTSDDPPMFRTFAPDGPIPQAKVIVSLAEGKDGTIWVGTAFGLFRATVANGEIKFEWIEVENGIRAGYYAFHNDPEGGIITVTSHGIFRIHDNGVKLLEPIGAQSIMRSADGRIWIGASGAPAGIRVYDFVNGRLNLLTTYTTRDGLLSDTFQYSICQLPDGRMFIGLGNGFQEFVGENTEGPKFRTITNDSVLALAQDTAGNLWLGTELKGAWQLQRSGFVSFGEKDGLSESEDIRAVYVSRDGDIYLPTRPQGVLHLGDDGKFERVFPFGVTGRSWGWTHLDLLSKDDEWWVPGNDGLRRYRKVNNYHELAATPPKKIYTRADGLHGDEVFMLFEDSRGDIWIVSGASPDSLARWDHVTDSIVAYTSKQGLPENNGPVSFAEDRAGNVWLGFFFGSAVRYRGGAFERFTAKEGLSDSMASALFVDSAGRLWIGTSGQGLFRVDDPDADVPAFVNVSTKDGLSSNQIICMTEDRFQQLYVGTGRGINRIDAKGNIEVFTQADGLPSNLVTRCATDQKGSLWFVSRSTLVRYQPEPKIVAAAPAVYIDKISVNGVPQKLSALGESVIKLPDLSSDQTQLQIDFFALTFGAGENIKYQYKLDDQDWSQPSDQQTVNLNLAPATHTFLVRAVRGDGVTSASAAVLDLTVLPPIWQRWWFVAASAAMIALLISLVYHYRTENLRRVNAALEEARSAEEDLRHAREETIVELERVRSRIASDLHDDIGASLTQIAVLSEVAQAQAGYGNGGSPETLQKITDVSNELVGTMGDIVWAINPAKDHLSDLTQRMRRVAADLLSPKGIVVHFNSREEDRAQTIKTNERREVFLIFKESINNIAKHSRAKNVYIDLGIQSELLMLKVQDDGVGFVSSPPSFEDTFSSAGASGNGLRNMRKRAAEMGGTFEIDSEPGRGTTSFLSLPLDAGHAADI